MEEKSSSWNVITTDHARETATGWIKMGFGGFLFFERRVLAEIDFGFI